MSADPNRRSQTGVIASFEQQVLGRLVPVGALHSSLESSAVEPGEGQMGNVG